MRIENFDALWRYQLREVNALLNFFDRVQINIEVFRNFVREALEVGRLHHDYKKTALLNRRRNAVEHQRHCDIEYAGQVYAIELNNENIARNLLTMDITNQSFDFTFRCFQVDDL